MTTTSYLRLQKPPFDTIPWDDAINGNMDIIDAFISQYMAVPNYVGVWANSTAYVAGQNTLDTTTAIIYTAAVTHTSSASPTTFAQDRTTNPSYWTASSAGFPIGSYATDEDIERANHNIGRNLLHNGLFRIAQRGAGPFTTGIYTLDRWFNALNLDTMSVVAQSLSDVYRTQIGDEEANYALANTFVGNAGAGAYNLVGHRIENVRRLAGKTVTVSFWAIAGSGTPKLGVSFNQSFGTGGSPSSAVPVNGQSVTLSGAFARYSLTFALPSISGKTLGSNSDDYLQLYFWYSCGATNATWAGNPGVQSGTIWLWGVQLEVGSVATPLEKPDLQQELANCQRFYQGGSFEVAGYNTAGSGVGAMHSFSTSMRAVPTLASSGVTQTNCTGALANPWAGGMLPYATATGTGALVYSGQFTASADL